MLIEWPKVNQRWLDSQYQEISRGAFELKAGTEMSISLNFYACYSLFFSREAMSYAFRLYNPGPDERPILI